MSTYQLLSARRVRHTRGAVFLVVALLCSTVLLQNSNAKPQSAGAAQQDSTGSAPLQLSRTVRPWEFLSAVGTEAGLFGNETGTVEAWVYPLKILRELHLRFQTDRRIIDSATLARSITARPESVTILYTGDTYNVRETFFVPVNEQGAIIKLEIETEHPLEIEALFQRDFQLEWPAALGGTYGFWDEPRHAFYFGEETKKFVALVGSPSATHEQVEYATNYSSSDQNGFYLGATEKGKATKLIVIAASVHGSAEADQTYHHLLADSDALQQSSANYYRDYLARTISLDLPDKQIQQAYDWSRISALQGVVKNPYLGAGIVAGYRTSGSGQRPGFAWFFGRDSLWTSLAYDAEGDFASTRTALDFLTKVQRADGKIPHEIAQGASLVPWFTDYPYAWASADATPLYIITMSDYVTKSGDIAFVKEKWPNLQKAYAFLKSTYDAQGLPQNFGIGHGWVEGGPLLPVKTELYQSGLGLEAVRATGNLAAIAGDESQSKDLAAAFDKQTSFLNDAFWLPETKHFAFALDQNNKKIDEPTVLSTVPMWFGLLDQEKANSMINELAKPSHQSDWGMRIIGSDAAEYSAGGYHFGAVWPLFTGWASVGEYRYHREAPAYANLRANALLAIDGALGHTTEVLSGDYYSSLSTSSPHQIWSAAMVVSSILRGMLGLSTNAATQTITFSPHVPATWSSFSTRDIHAGNCTVDLNYTKTPDSITLVANRMGAAKDNGAVRTCTLDFSPSVSLRANVAGGMLDSHTLSIHTQANANDQHVQTHITLHPGVNTITIRLWDDFAVSYAPPLPELGTASRELHILSQEWSAIRDSLTLHLAGIADQEYFLLVSDAQQIASIDGGTLLKSDAPRIRIQMPTGKLKTFVNGTVTVHFKPRHQNTKKSES
jgi:glycogen debranching enzyme